MKKLLLNLIGIALFLCCITNNSKAQWALQNTQSAYNIVGIKAADNSNLYYWSWTVSSTGNFTTRVDRSFDGGNTWVNVYFAGASVQNTIYDLDCFGVNDVWHVAKNGVIVRTTNGGVNWTSQVSGTTSDLYAVDFVDGSNGWAVGVNGTIIRTLNGGTTWTTQTSGTTNTLNSVHFINSTTGYAVGNSGTILKTTNGGTSWTTISPSIPSFTGYNLNDVKFANTSNGWIVGTGGLIIKTTDGGMNWGLQNSNITQELNSIDLTDANNAWIAAGLSNNNGVILNTNNGGTAWNIQLFGGFPEFNSISFLADGAGWANSDDNIYKYSSPANVSENTFTTHVNVYPNPTNGAIHVNFEEPQNELQITVYSIDGRILQNFTKNQMDNFSFEIDEPAGLYLVEIINDKNEKATFRLIKE